MVFLALDFDLFCKVTNVSSAGLESGLEGEVDLKLPESLLDLLGLAGSWLPDGSASFSTLPSLADFPLLLPLFLAVAVVFPSRPLLE